MVRGGIYSAVFLALMAVLGLTTPTLALAALPATLLVGFAFGAAVVFSAREGFIQVPHSIQIGFFWQALDRRSSSNQ